MMTSAVPKLGAVVMMAFSMLFAASPSMASSTVAIRGPSRPLRPAGRVRSPSQGNARPIERACRGRCRNAPAIPSHSGNASGQSQAAIFAGGDLYVSYSPSGPESGFRVERIDPKTGVLARSQWFPRLQLASRCGVRFDLGSGRTGCPYRIIRLSQETLAVTMRTPIPRPSALLFAADDGALWFLGASSARLARLNPHTGRFSTVLLPEMAPDSNVAWFASDPKSGLLYISVVNQNVAHSQVTERFDPTTGSFFIVPTPPYETHPRARVAGDILWVIQGGGMMTHFAPFSTASLAPVSCTRAVICALAGFNGAVDGSVEDGIFAFEHIGGTHGRHGPCACLQCIGRSQSVDGGPAATTQATFPFRVARHFRPSCLPSGAATSSRLARVGTDGGSGVAIFPLDPRCAP